MANIDGEKIRQLREEKGLTQLYVATFVGVTTDTISRWENRRYPTIKQENALKLAEALEVTLDEILEDEQTSTAATLEKSTVAWEVASDKGGMVQRSGRWGKIWPFLVLIVFIAAGWWYYSGNNKVVVSAQRVMPLHTPPGEFFPVIIQIKASGKGPFSLILKETLPDGCEPVQSEPAFTNIDKNNGEIKWIIRAGGEKITIAYLARTAKGEAEGGQHRLSGTVTLRNSTSSSAQIKGSSVITSANFHWVDFDKDGKISDDEILAAYDKYGALDALNFDWEKVDDIWSGQGYRWDAAAHRFVIIP